MERVTAIWSAVSGACLMLALMHLVIWFRNRHSWANLWFFIATLGVVGQAACELVTMHTRSPEVYAAGIRYAHLVYLLTASGILGNAQVGSGSLRTTPPDLVEMAAILDDIADDAKRAGGIIHGMRTMFKKDAVTDPCPLDSALVVECCAVGVSSLGLRSARCARPGRCRQTALNGIR